jgi:ketosteroid isomerase-like protein
MYAGKALAAKMRATQVWTTQKDSWQLAAIHFSELAQQ